MTKPKHPPKPLTETDMVIKRLGYILRNHSKRLVKNRVMVVTALPMFNDLEFEGTPLMTLMSPDVPSTGIETQAIFDAWLYPKFTEDGGDPKADLIEASSEALADFISSASGDFGVQAVRLLYALGKAEGATMTYDAKNIMVEHDGVTYGIKDGHVVSRFCTGMHVNCNPARTLEAKRDMRVFSNDFCNLWVESRRHPETCNALIALLMGHPLQVFKDIVTAARKAIRQGNPLETQLKRFERTIMTVTRDPVGVLYKHLVPAWMTKGQFARTICPLGLRPMQLTPETQQLYITKMYGFFYEKQKSPKVSNP